MASVTREQLIKRVFSDPKHYPYGFARSGDFSINESRALGQYGALIAALVDGLISPENEDDHGYLAAAHGRKQPESVIEKAWVKYQKRINRPKAASIYGSKHAAVEDPDDSDTNIDDNSDLSLEIDDD